MASPPLTPDQLFARLDSLGIAHKTYTHPPVFTVVEAVALRGQLPGGHCKSLFLKDKKGRLWLLVAPAGGPVDVKRVGQWAWGARLFVAPSRNLVLGVRGGSRPRTPLP